MTRRQQYVKFFIALILGGVVLIIAYLANGTSTLNPKEIEKLASFIQAIDSGEYTHEFDDGIRKLGIESIEKREEDTWFVITENKGGIVFFDNAKTDNFILIEASFYKLAENGIKNYFIYAMGIVTLFAICDFLYMIYTKKRHNKKPGTKQHKEELKLENKKPASEENEKGKKKGIPQEDQKEEKEDEVKHPEELIIKRL